MDVVHITHQFAPETRGGVESYVLDVATAQQEAGMRVHVLSGTHAPRPRVTVAPFTVAGLSCHRLHRDDLYFDLHGKQWHPGVGDAVAAFLREHRPQVVHVHQWLRLTGDLVRIAREQGIPAVITVHDYYTTCPRAFRRRPGHGPCAEPLGSAACVTCAPCYGHEGEAERREAVDLFAQTMRAELTHAAAVLVAVDGTADLVAHTTGVDRDRFTVLPLGYRRRWPGAELLPGPTAGEPFRFAFWGGVAPHKGVAELLRAFRSLCAEGLAGAAELHVLGHFATTQFRTELEALAAGLPVTLHGPFATADLRALRPHVGVFPSTCLETFGIVLDECFELGLPCVVSDLGALGGRAGNGGLRVPAGDVAALATTLGRFLREPELWARLRAGLPAPAPDVAGHCRLLERIYAAARRGPAPDGSPYPTVSRRLAFVQVQRESALARLPRPQG